MRFPAVIKVGNFHGGFGKSLVRTAEEWAAVSEMVFAAGSYVCVEPYVTHRRDLRCLLIGDRVWCMERRGGGWKANVRTVKATLVAAPTELEEATRRYAQKSGACVVSLDALDTDDGLVVLESNETPGLTGFPDAARVAVAELLVDAMREAGAVDKEND